jgi:hypothetical protein
VSALFLLFAAPATAAEPAKPITHHLEASLRFGGQVVTGEVAQPSLTPSDRTVGSEVGLSLGYLAPYFLHPFLDVTFAHLSTGSTLLPIAGPWGAPGYVSSELSTWVGHVGAGWDISRVRLRAGIGFASLINATSFGSAKDSTTSLAGSGMFSLGVDLVQTKVLVLDAEVRAVGLPSTHLGWVALSLGLRSRFLSW